MTVLQALLWRAVLVPLFNQKLPTPVLLFFFPWKMEIYECICLCWQKAIWVVGRGNQPTCIQKCNSVLAGEARPSVFSPTWTKRNMTRLSRQQEVPLRVRKMKTEAAIKWQTVTGESIMASPHFSGILPFFHAPRKRCSQTAAKNKICDLYLWTGIHAPLTSCCFPHPPYPKQFMEAGLNKH